MTAIAPSPRVWSLRTRLIALLSGVVLCAVSTLAAAVALGGTIWAASKKTTMFVWPLIGLVLVVVALVLGTALLNAGVGMDFAAAAVARR